MPLPCWAAMPDATGASRYNQRTSIRRTATFCAILVLLTISVKRCAVGILNEPRATCLTEDGSAIAGASFHGRSSCSDRTSYLKLKLYGFARNLRVRSACVAGVGPFRPSLGL